MLHLLLFIMYSLCQNSSASHHFWQSGIYCCRPDCLELAARLSPWSIA